MITKETLITVPPRWDDLKDKEYVQERYGENGHPHVRRALDAVVEAYQKFETVLNRAFAHQFESYNVGPFAGAALSAQEKLDRISDNIVLCLSEPRHMDRLLEALGVCALVNMERHRILRMVGTPLYGMWGVELGELAAALTEAAAQLERCLIGEYDDYEEELVCYRPASGDEVDT